MLEIFGWCAGERSKLIAAGADGNMIAPSQRAPSMSLDQRLKVLQKYAATPQIEQDAKSVCDPTQFDIFTPRDPPRSEQGYTDTVIAVVDADAPCFEIFTPSPGGTTEKLLFTDMDDSGSDVETTVKRNHRIDEDHPLRGLPSLSRIDGWHLMIDHQSEISSWREEGAWMRGSRQPEECFSPGEFAGQGPCSIVSPSPKDPSRILDQPVAALRRYESAPQMGQDADSAVACRHYRARYDTARRGPDAVTELMGADGALVAACAESPPRRRSLCLGDVRRFSADDVSKSPLWRLTATLERASLQLEKRRGSVEFAVQYPWSSASPDTPACHFRNCGA